jgi:D-serine deaminase-like pyridoxal phosphate-dependent protein
MDRRYRIEDTSRIVSPGIVLFREILEENLDKMIAIAGDPARLRPHCKTHKMREVTLLELSRGISKHKAATFAEAEMLADAGVKDIFLAYNLVGPNVRRAVRFVEKFADVIFSVTADHARPIAELSEAMTQSRASIEVLLDIDTGLHRTGVAVGREAKALYRQIAESPGLKPGGLHVYDGQHHQPSPDERRTAVESDWAGIIQFRDELQNDHLPIPRLVAGGTASFPIYAAKDDPTIELSPGTCVFNDAGYGSRYADMNFMPAALLLTRVISRPTSNRVTLDLGYKAIASDPPAGSRAVFPDLPDAKQVLQNEEHLVLETERAREFAPGDELLAIPWHICPTSALHKEVAIIAGGNLIERWAVTARDRQLTI